jgi:biopolymer transport protein ExbD
MRWEKKHRNAIPALDLTPCSDIIFTLLLFFILTQSFVTTLPINLPSTSGPVRSVSTEVQRVEIAADGRIFLNGQKTDQAGLKTAFAALATQGATQTAVLVLADTLSPAGVSIEVLDLLRLSGFYHASFAGTGAPVKKSDAK